MVVNIVFLEGSKSTFDVFCWAVRVGSEAIFVEVSFLNFWPHNGVPVPLEADSAGVAEHRSCAK